MEYADRCDIRLDTAACTRLAGSSLARTVYALPVTLLLRGELGAGKTTMLSGLGAALGVCEPLTSPTYALEQRYRATVLLPDGPSDTTLLHLDLYRLTTAQAAELVRSSDDHAGIRAIEWSQRLPQWDAGAPTIEIELLEAPEGRTALAGFGDIAVPTRSDILSWREQVHLPDHVRRHCDAVAGVCRTLASRLQERGVFVRQLALERAAEVHDLLRFLDFRTGAAPADFAQSALQDRVWQEWRSRFPGMHHEEACSAFLSQRGYPALASMVLPHGLNVEAATRRTVEQQLLFYADKRIVVDKLVSLDERFADFRARYRGGKETEQAARWHAEVLEVEKKLFPEGDPLKGK